MSRLSASGTLIASFGAVLVILAPIVAGGTPAPAASESSKSRELSIAWVGDITPGSRYGTPPDRGRPLFAALRGRLRSADVTLGNLEGTFSVGGTSKCGTDGGNCFSFQAPPENADSLKWAGFDLLNLANNHAFDFGPSGQGQTVAALEESGLAYTGRPGEIKIIRRRGVKIAVLGFAPYRWANDPRDLSVVRQFVGAAASRADVVIVLAHAGGEGNNQSHVPYGPEFAMGEDRGDTRAFAHAAVDAGADLILGSGPHVLRGIELYRGKLIAYSLGNFAGWHNFSRAGAMALSGLLTVRVSNGGALRGGRFTALRLVGPGVPTLDDSRAATMLISSLGREDFPGTGLHLLDDGSF